MSETLIAKVLANSVQSGDCLLWKGAMCNGIVPSMYFEGKTIAIRRAIWVAQGRGFVKGMAVNSKCKEPCCVAPEHLVQQRPRKAGKKTALHIANVTAKSRARAKLTEAAAEAIRNSDDRSVVLADRYGISTSYVRYIKRSERWRPVTSPFSGLFGARG